MAMHQTIIGRAELVSLPDLSLDMIPAKADTGAYRSAIHAVNIRLETRGSKKVLCFDLLAHHPNAACNHYIETETFTTAVVENSFGAKERRYAVDLRIKIGPKIVKTQFTLADRALKTYPVLLGRKLLNKRFLVNSDQSNIDRRELKRKLNLDIAQDLEVVDP